MSDFSNVLSFEKFIEGVSYWQKNKNYTNNIFLEAHMEKYLNFLYSRALYLASQNTSIFMEIAKTALQYEEILNVEEITFIDMDMELIKLEKETMRNLQLPNNIDLKDKRNAYAILNSLSNQYSNTIRNILSGFSREELTKIFIAYANSISYICMQSYEWSSNSYFDKNKMNLISQTLHIIEKNKVSDLRYFFGSDKKVFEYLIHYVLNCEFDLKEKTSRNSTLNIKDLLYVTNLFLNIEQQKKYIDFLYENKGSMTLEDELLRIEDSFAKDISKYFSSTAEFKRDIESKELDEIYQAFEEIRGYSPFILEEYIHNYDDKFLETRTIITFIEKEALVEDIYHKTGRDKVAIQLMLDDLTLRKCPKNGLLKSTFSDDNRLFRTPLIENKSYYIVPFNIFVESALYFRQRILKNHLKKGLDKKIKRLVERNYDEYDLQRLNVVLAEKNVIGNINFDLNKFTECKKLFELNPSISQEIDFYYIKNNTLHLMELKNREMDKNLYGLSQSLSKAKKNITRMNERRLFILKYKDIFQKILGDRFDTVELYLVNKNPHYLDNTFNYEYKISIFRFEDFYEYIHRNI